MTETPFLRRTLYAMVAVCLLAGLLSAAVVGNSDGDGEQVATTGTTTTSTAVPPVTGDGGDGGDGGSAAGGGGDVAGTTAPASTEAAPSTTVGASGSGGGSAAAPATTAAPSTTAAPPEAGGFADLGPAPDGGAVAMPKPGTYTYAITGGEEPSEGTTRYDDKGAAPGGQQFVVTMKGMGIDSTSDVVWGASDVKVQKTTLAFGGQSVMCDWEPDHVELVIPLAKGKEWTSSSSCTVGTAIVKRTSSTKVVDARRVRVAGKEIPVWVLEGTEKFDVNGQVREGRGTTWFSGAHGIIVRSTSESSEGSRQIEIKSLDPS